MQEINQNQKCLAKGVSIVKEEERRIKTTGTYNVTIVINGGHYMADWWHGKGKLGIETEIEARAVHDKSNEVCISND